MHVLDPIELKIAEREHLFIRQQLDRNFGCCTIEPFDHGILDTSVRLI